MYSLRDVTATVGNTALIASSIMSKKLAGGAHGILLDVKVGSGAFMKTVSDASEPLWMKLPAKLLREKPSVNPREGDPLPEPLEVLVRRALEAPPSVTI